MKLASNYQLRRFFQSLKISLCNLFSKEKNLTLSHFQTLKWEPQSPGSLKDSETVTMWNRLVILARARSRTALVKPITTAFMTIKRNSVHSLFVSIWGRASATKHFARLTYQESAKSTTWSWEPEKKEETPNQEATLSSIICEPVRFVGMTTRLERLDGKNKTALSKSLYSCSCLESWLELLWLWGDRLSKNLITTESQDPCLETNCSARNHY